MSPNSTAAAPAGAVESRLFSSESSSLLLLRPGRHEFVHTPNYCEENVYLLCKQLISVGIADSVGSDLYVILVSNDTKQVPLWCQRASKKPDGLVIWDYHVFCIQKGTRDLVWDLDSTLEFPIPLGQYILEAIRPSLDLHPAFRRLFRVVHAPLYLRHFTSDRSHMKDSSGNWISPPPSYGPITSDDGGVHNLNQYMSISQDSVIENMEDAVDSVYFNMFGVIICEDHLQKLFDRIPLPRLTS